MKSSRKPLRLGILGCANIARQFARDVAPSSAVRVVAVASRNEETAASFAKANAIGRHHGSYEALLADPEVDVVYVPLPNSLHAEWSIKAAEAGKHILCEKPLALNHAQARSMFDAAERHGVMLLEEFLNHTSDGAGVHPYGYLQSQLRVRRGTANTLRR
jgi:predicted dehydrogenase